MATQKKFVVKNGLIASDLSYPTSDGTANQSLLTDGTGNLSFGTLSTSTVTEGSNLYYTDARADARVALIVDAAPSTLDTLNELAAALGDDANFSTTVTNSIANKLPLAGGTITGDVSFTNGNKAVFGGTGQGSLEIFAHATNNNVYISENAAGNLNLGADNFNIYTNAFTKQVASFTAGSAKLLNDGNEKLATTATGIDVTGDVSLADGGRATFGTGDDLQIYHTGGTSVINDVGTGRLFIGGSPGVDIGAPEIDEYYIRAYNDGAVELYYDNAKKLETTSTGIDVTGTVRADDLTIGHTSNFSNALANDIQVGTVTGSHGISILSQNNSYSSLFFADNNNNDAGSIRYNHSNNTIDVYTDRAQRVAINSTGIDVTGTTTTDQYLYVNSPNGTQLQLRSEDAYTTLGAGNRNLNVSANRTIFLDDAFAEVMRINDDGNVGIGTAAPATALHVRGTASTVGATRSVVTLTDDTAMGINVGSGVAFRGLYTSAGAEANYGGIFAGKSNANSGNANGYLSLSYSASGTLTEGIRISETGKVGIGDSTPTANGLTLFSSVTGATRINLHIGGTGTVPNSGSFNTISNNHHGDILISSNAYINGSGNPVITSNHANMGGTGIKIAGASGSHDIKFYTSNAANFVRGTEQTNTERMTISKYGKVGIGEVNPLHPLHVDGTIYSTNNIQLNSTKQVLFGNGNQYIKGTNDTSIEIGTGGTATITATHAGDVLIGSTTNTNTGLLQVDGAISAKVHHELFTVGTIASNIVSLDLNTGTSVVTVASPGANFSLAITNVPNTGNTTTGIAAIVTQGGSPFIPNALTVNGSAVTINWLGGSAPAGTASKTEIFSFTVINTGGVFTALGSVSTFG